MNLEKSTENIMIRYWRNARYILPMKPLIILTIFIFVVLLPLICWNLQHSAYFMKGDLNYAAYRKRLSNNRRIAEARTYFNEKYKFNLLPFNYLKMKSKAIPKSIYPQIAIIVLAQNRDTHQIDAYEPKYLTQTLHTLLVAIDKDVLKFGLRWSNIFITMCNVDKNPKKFFEFQNLSKYFHNMTSSSFQQQSVKGNCRSKLDLISCLDIGLKNYPQVNKFIIIEDDLLAEKSFLFGLEQVFKSLQYRFLEKISSKLAFVQLYYPKHELKFSFWDSNSWLELLLISFSLVFILLIVYFRFHMRPLFVVYNILLFLVLLLICAAFVLAIGRPHWRAAYHSVTASYSLVESMTSSTAAVLAEREYLQDLIPKSVDQVICEQLDSKSRFMAAVANATGRRMLSVNRNLFRHVGLYSAFSKTIINPHLID